MPLEWHAAAVTNPAKPPPATNTRRGSSVVRSRSLASPAGGGERHQASLSASPVSMPRRAAASAAAVRARALTSSTRSGDSSTLFGAVGSAKMRLAESGVLTLFSFGASPSASHGISNFASLNKSATAFVGARRWCGVVGATSACAVAARPRRAAVLGMAASFLPPGVGGWWLLHEWCVVVTW